MIKTLGKWLAFVGLAFFIAACSSPAKLQSYSGNTMGTTYHIKLVPNDSLPDAQLLQAEIDLALEQVNDQMSTYRPDSELSRFNKLALAQSVVVSPDTLKVVEEGIRLHKLTHGALDITMGPLVNLWGFGPDARPTSIPSQFEIDEAMADVGIEGIKISGDRLEKTKPELYVDLSSIAKGFGVDKIAAILDKYGVTGYLVEIGGEVSLKGTKAGGEPWRIAVERPTEDARTVQLVIEPKDIAIATSGDYRNYYEEEGQRFSHIIDPRTGYPIEHKLASVTVMDKSCMVADGLATAMMVMGTKESLALAEREGLAVMLIEYQGDGFKTYYSEAFKPYITQQ
ncbi:FAD:protein FMN transferase [Shewanella submarina]|uniref:FAD:protein FMN transferase n=1 Tax=Shewanella submarina TaxID=2016376 RepID=A0ABV7GBB9_9GAMM|nr:FAD:protein FMN transferase [Shewanella submarina]MCL1037289.1 FAD:protein FMN transferase [Shewanella submarina]